MILTTYTLTHFLQNRRCTWDLSQKRSFSSHLATANPNGTAWFNTSKTPFETASPNGTTTQTCHFHETLRLCSKMHHLSCMTYHFCANHNGIAAQTDTWHIHEKSLFGALPNGRAIGLGFEHFRTVANGCGRLRTVANTKTTTSEHSPILRRPS